MTSGRTCEHFGAFECAKCVERRLRRKIAREIRALKSDEGTIGEALRAEHIEECARIALGKKGKS